jgi:dihydroxyacetone synthase
MRTMPGVLFLRPADTEETAEAWTLALNTKDKPSVISLCRHVVPQLSNTFRDNVASGAYVICEPANANVTIIGVGSELHLAIEAAQLIEKSDSSIHPQIVSFLVSHSWPNHWSISVV